ncbi:MAG: hypothetical protein R8N23_04460 [Reichenbachiella sp.]|uniref:hypothetical protein n=1 Tax=Reichenbachiella sp. TaxID=2184521 RepID=UPI002966B0FC|nr:hypothetical protein [Reichenbachiella sp.]MDW3209094.1 hypothetical protein [Reichenbachiella sp.]
MKLTTTLIIFLTLVSCKERSTSFEEIQCSPSTTSENDNIGQVFKPCRQYIYQAKYWDEDYNLISDELIWMMATGKDWDAQPELQDEIIIQYNYSEDKIDEIKKFGINKTLDYPWERKVITGIIENKNQTFMHPFRQNQYAFTEVAPFPSVNFPLEIGKTWDSNMNISGWGDWAESTLKESYEVIGRDSIELPIGVLQAWHVRGIAYADFGNSQNDFWYNEKFGFVKTIIKNYKNQLLKFELQEIIEE